MEISLRSIADKFDLLYDGSEDIRIRGLCGLSDNFKDHLSFVTEHSQMQLASESNITAFVSHPDFPVPEKENLLHENPEYAIAKIASLFLHEQLSLAETIDRTATIDRSTELGPDVSIGANVVVGANCKIGAGTRIFPNVTIFDRVIIGANCVIYPGTTIREGSVLGDRVVLQSGVSIGGDGYGYVLHKGKHAKIPQLGNVVIENDVEVGANSTIDRGRFTETRIGSGTKIDNLVMVAHNVQIGNDCLLISQVGISGSTKLGDRVTLGGQVGTIGHVTITNDVTVLGKGGVTKDIRSPGVFAGMPIRPARLWRKAMAKLYAGLK